ncbi:MAG TPA: hypothetical protein ENH34_01680 [Phycisphaerales bacterium]|nr:hypothetical protein [Phycisphaerales bacterium]
MTDDNSKIEYEQTLTKIIAEKGALSVKEATAVTLQLVKAVDNLHTEGKVHRQIHTDTVLLDQAMSAKLSPIRPLITIGGVDVGAVPCPPQLHNIPPVSLPVEIKAAQQVLTEAGIFLDPRQIDFYQLGALLCFMVSGRSVSDYLRSCKAKATVPEVIRSVIDRALGLNSKNCFSSSIAFAAALQAVIDGKTTPKSDLLRLPGSIFVEPIAKAKLQAPRDTSTASEETLPFKKLGHYQIIERIGHGGMGDVYKGYEKALDRFVAIKVLPAELGRQRDFVKRFHTEATAIAKLDHPNVVRIYYTGEDRGYHFFAMQYIDGETLADLLTRRRKLSANEALPIIEQCLAGIGAAHKRGLIHRDVKPGNVILDRHSRRALVTDFGVVKAVQAETQITITGTIMGTADYIAPEQARGQDIDCRADLYAMGILMYQMLSGQLPFEAKSATSMMFQHAYEPPPPLTEIAPDVPSPLAGIVMKLMAKKPEDRYQSTDDVLTNLHKIRLAPAATVTGTSQTNIVKAPEFYTTPEVPHNLSKLTGENWFGRLMNWITDFFGIHAPQVIDYMQTTSQQVDGAVAEYQKRRDKLAELGKEARTAATELDAQAKASRTAAQVAGERAEAAKSTTAKHQALKEKQENEQTAAELAQLAAEQAEQSEDISLRLAKLDAKLVQLRSQRNALNARLNIAQAHLKTEGTTFRRWFVQQRKFLWFALAVLTITAVFLLPRIMAPKVGFIVSFKSIEPFEPQTARELLKAFNENHPRGIRTHHFRTQVQGRKLIGFICVDNKAGKMAIVNMLEKTDRLMLVDVRAVTAKELEKYYLLGQPSMPLPDKEIIGTWRSVDFVREVEYFKPGEKQWTDDLYLKRLTFYKDGKTSGPWTWKDGYLWHPGNRTKARYLIKKMDGSTYLFMEWMSDEVTIRGQKPPYYVMKKVPTTVRSQPLEGLIAHWKFDEGSGNTAYDSAGKNNGTIHGAKWTTGKIGEALSFNGDGDYVTVGSDVSIADIADNFTISLWANPLATHQIDSESATSWPGSAGQKYAIAPMHGDGMWGAGHVGAGISIGTNGISVYEHADRYFPPLLVWEGTLSGFTYVTVVYENKQPKLYVNGVLKKTGLTSQKIVHVLPGSIGGADYGYFKGLIDEVKIYNRALSAEEIKQL